MPRNHGDYGTVKVADDDRGVLAAKAKRLLGEAAVHVGETERLVGRLEDAVLTDAWGMLDREARVMVDVGLCLTTEALAAAEAASAAWRDVKGGGGGLPRACFAATNDDIYPHGGGHRGAATQRVLTRMLTGPAA